jgi:GTP cyclohydrolase II
MKTSIARLQALAAATPVGEAPAPRGTVHVRAAAHLPTRFGDLAIVGFSQGTDDKEHVAFVHGDVVGKADVPTRIHSECLTGDVAGSLRCDCRDQLELALTRISRLPTGIVLYLRQEGRGIGLLNKIRAYALQETGLDTVDANLALGFRDDERDYGVAAQMLTALQVTSVQLMTNNPAKVASLQALGIAVTARLPHATPANPHNAAYLRTKATRSGHHLDIDAEGTEARGLPVSRRVCRSAGKR